MWMGGKAPLGYTVQNRKLLVSDTEAPRARYVFKLFAETESGTETVRRLRVEGVGGKTGRLFEKGDLYKLLNNRTYIGEAVHKGRCYPGEHLPIVSRDLWDRVHAILKESPRARA